VQRSARALRSSGQNATVLSARWRPGKAVCASDRLPEERPHSIKKKKTYLSVELLTCGWRSVRLVLPPLPGHESPKFLTKDTQLLSPFIPQPTNAYLLHRATTCHPALHVVMPESRHHDTKRAIHATYQEALHRHQVE
jgi:hypothetical protein